jgi:hypothetical protein
MATRKRSSRTESKERLLAVRIPERLLLALNAHADALRRETPWVEMSRSDVVRWLLSRALEQELGQAASGERPPASPSPGRS